MPRYLFNIHNGNGLTEDEEGHELVDDEAARREALKGIRSIIAEDVREGIVDLDGRIEVLDEAGNLHLTVRFTDAVRIKVPAT